MQRILKTFFVILFIAIFILYLKNDGLYVLSKITDTKMEMVNKYTIEFPKDTVIQSFSLNKDYDSWILYHNEYLEAILLVPIDSIDGLFPDNVRDADPKHFNHRDNLENFKFGVWGVNTVVKWLDKTQRSIIFRVVEYDDIYTQVYVYVDKLGWNIYK